MTDTKKTDTKVVISVKGVSKYFAPSKGSGTMKQAFTALFKSDNDTYKREGYWALNDINFEIKKGEFFGIVGRNGSGKSTLLKMIAGIYESTDGEIKTDGKIVPFIELGVGFNPELSGMDNVFLNGALLGFTRKEMQEMYDEIVAFAELEDHMNVKLKNFSSGMQVRLAFSIAIRAKSDILLIDEVLAVGDAAFQSKCFDYFYKLKKQGATVVFVSHDRTSLERFCDRGILIDGGELVESGPISKVLRSYTSVVLDELGSSDGSVVEKIKSIKPKTPEYAEIVNVRSASEDGIVRKKFAFGDKIVLSYDVLIKKDISNPILGITVWQKNLEKAVFASNTLIDDIKETGKFKKDDRISFKIEIPSLLNDGEYSVEPAIASESAAIFYDQKHDAAVFFISGSANPHSLVSSANKIILGVK